MLKNSLYTLIFISLLFVSCKTTKAVSDGDDSMLLGKITKTDLSNHLPYSTWFNDNYTNYKYDKNIIDSIKLNLKNVSFKIFLGTWCSDSKRQVPRFYRILNELDFDLKKVNLITLDKEKQSPNKEKKGFNIIRVPTIIVYKNNEEINRIVEVPIVSLEKDLLIILTSINYKHAYKK
jgi:thiol-disulfide isomerase/thioredoxin